MILKLEEKMKSVIAEIKKANQCSVIGDSIQVRSEIKS